MTWTSIWGDISTLEAVLRDASGKTIRPFLAKARIVQNGYSLGLQRAALDFAAESPYAKVAGRIKEHYRIDLPAGGAARIAGKHLAAIDDQAAMPAPRRGESPTQLIASVDGCMVPVVMPGDPLQPRTLGWMELKLCMVRVHGETEAAFAGSIGEPAKAGVHLAALAAAAAPQTAPPIHAIGDGAPWIAEQVELAFGARSSYLIDWFHACEYLSAAAPAFAKSGQPGWLDEMKSHLAEGRPKEVLAALLPRRERARKAGSKKSTPVRDCWRYLSKRLGQLGYKEALAAGLPIGSGEIESAHRYVVQARLKRSGAWWKPENAQAMVRLRAMRLNGRWEEYWSAKLEVNELSL